MADDVVEQEAQETKPSKAERKAERLQAATEKNKELRGTVVDDVRALGESAMRKIKEKGEGDQSDDETEAATGAQPQVHRADVLVVLLEIPTLHQGTVGQGVEGAPGVAGPKDEGSEEDGH